jgi:hypothetical protein
MRDLDSALCPPAFSDVTDAQLQRSALLRSVQEHCLPHDRVPVALDESDFTLWCTYVEETQAPTDVDGVVTLWLVRAVSSHNIAHHEQRRRVLASASIAYVIVRQDHQFHGTEDCLLSTLASCALTAPLAPQCSVVADPDTCAVT